MTELPVTHVEAAGLTDRGLARANNEDAFFVDPQGRLFVIADGLGGHAAGEVASGLVVDTLAAAAPGAVTWSDPAQELGASLARADAAVREQARDALTGMGATVVAIHLAPPMAAVTVAHAGDSRAYRLRAAALSRLTRDHTPEAETGSARTAAAAASSPAPSASATGRPQSTSAAPTSTPATFTCSAATASPT